MSTNDLSILIPARNEIFLARTIQDILENIEGKTEIIAVLDGYLPDPPLQADPRCTVIYHPVSIGQRASTNEAAKLSKAKYLMKCDAHCAFDKGFDRKMMAKMEDDITMVPVMRNLHVFNWVCNTCGMETYQGPDPITCRNETCNFDQNGGDIKSNFRKEIVWIPKTNPQSSAYRFNKDLRFKYFPELRAKQAKEGLVETMSLQGSCFLCTREKYWDLGLCDESWGSWGQQGTEVALKTWLSGGRVLCNRDTWYAHLFRTQGGFGHPYPGVAESQQHAIKISEEIFINDKWDKAIHPLSWLLDKFWFALKEVGDQDARWTEADLAKLKANTFKFSDQSSSPKPAESEPPANLPSKGIIYYTDSELDEKIARPVRDQLQKISREKNIHIVSASLKKMDFGVKNIHFPSLKRGYLAMFKQIKAALEHNPAQIIFFCEHDMLYHPSHFDFVPADENTFYYNQNVWFLRASDGHALHYDVNQLSGLCGGRVALLTHFTERYELIEKEGFTRKMGFEPMTHNRIKWNNMYKYSTWKSKYPNIDIRHAGNVTGQRWKKSQFRNQKLLKGWKKSDIDHIPGWENLRELI